MKPRRILPDPHTPPMLPSNYYYGTRHRGVLIVQKDIPNSGHEPMMRKLLNRKIIRKFALRSPHVIGFRLAPIGSLRTRQRPDPYPERVSQPSA